MDNFNFKKYLAEGKLLKENAPGYDTRKMGEALPTLESVKAAYEAKNDIKEYDSDIENQTGDDFGFWFRAGVKAEKQIQQAKDLLTQNGIEFNAEGRFGIDFQGKGYEKREIVQLLRDNGLTLFVIYDHEKEDTINEELVDFEGNDMYPEIKGDMKRYYKMDVPMNVIKDWANDYFSDRYDDKDDYEFETSAREDFLDHLEDIKDSNASDEDKELQKQVDIQAKSARRVTSRTRDLAMAKGLSMDDYFDSIDEGKLLKENAPGYDTRKQGEALPTLESVKAAYEAKNDIKENKYDIEDPESPMYALEDNDQDVAILNNMTKKYGKDVVLMWLSSGEYGDQEYFEESVIKEK